MDFINILLNDSFIGIMFFSFLGLCVGSFLNVVIYRIPLQMNYEWRRACLEILGEQKDIDTDDLTKLKKIIEADPKVTLSSPASNCPNCQHKIRWYENIPIISWLFLKGQCSNCKQSISSRYPLIELFTAIISGLVIYKFGVTLQGMSALIFTWILIALAGIDFDTQLLPDRLVFPLAGLGLLVNTQSLFVETPPQAIFGLIIGFLSLWSVTSIYALFTGKQGMGGGDFKLLAALGAWLGVKMLFLIVLLSSFLGAIIGSILLIKKGESVPFAFGPYIALAGMIALFFGDNIIQSYLSLYS